MLGFGLAAGEPPETEEAARWLSLARSGDAAAFEALLRTHEVQVARTALRLLGNRQDEAGLVRDQQRRMVREALRALPERERAALTLRDLEGLSTGEVAAILGSTEATVRSQVSAARLKIRKMLGSRL